MCNTVHYSDDVTAAIVFCSIFQLFLVQNYFSIWSKGAKKVYQILNTVKYISVFSFENTHQRDFFCLASDFCLVQFNCFRFWNNSRGKKPSKSVK